MANKSNSSILIFILVIFSLILNQFPSWSQDNNIQFTASYPSEVAANEPFDVVFSINAPHSKDFKAPGFRGFNILFGPAQSQSSSMQFINGVSSQSFALSYSYRLQAPTPGDFRFDPATIVVDGKKYATPSIRIKVSSSKSSSSRSNGNGSASNNRNSESTASSATISNKDLFIRSSINKSNPYLGEEIILTYRIYTAVPVEQYNIYKTPSNKGFWAEELKLNNHEQKTEIINNRRYIFADIRKVALFGQETGNLTLEPMEIEALAQVQAPRRGGSGSIFDIFDDPFFDPVQYVKKNLRSEAIHIKVKPLPTEGKPASFNGLVGNYKVSFSYDQEKEIRSNEAISFKFKVIGKGNIELVQQPNLLFPPDFDVYEPKITHQKNISESGINGTTQYEYIVVPRNPGVYKINAFDFSFFNPQSAKYETITIPEIVLNVKQGNGNAYSSSG
ncbi:MAG: BatD family protein, partial [Bacteroidales bacterium]